MKLMKLIWALFMAPRIALANEVTERRMLGLANEVSATDDWFQFAPIGEFDHSAGLQRVDAKAVTAMANEFNSVAGRLKTTFVGRPIYAGHPDLAPQMYPDKKAYGWITALQARVSNPPAAGDGLYAKAKWSDEGKTMLANGHYKFHSPYWDVDLIGREKGRNVYRPKTVFSAGLTNEPNIPVLPLANEKENQMERAVLIAALGLANTATDADITTAIGALRAEVEKIPGLANEKTTLANDVTAKENALANERTAHTATKTTLANVAKQRNELALGNAIAAGRITPAERAEWEGKLVADYDVNAPLLEKKAKSIKTASALANAGERRGGLANAAATKFTSNVRTRMANEKINWNQAWAAEKETSAELFAQMEAEGSSAE